MLLFESNTDAFDINLFDNLAKNTFSPSARISGEFENINVLTNGYEN